MNRSAKTAIFIVVLALGLGLLSLLIPRPPVTRMSAPVYYIYLVISFVVTTLHIGAALFFVRAFGAFTDKLKLAYGLVCAGLVLYGLAQLQLPILAFVNGFESWWVTSGVIVVVYIAPTLFLFWGFKKFARLFGVKSIFNSFWTAFSLATALAVASTFLPHYPSISPEIEFDINTGLQVWAFVFLAFMAISVIQMKRAAGAVYANSLAWVFLGLVGIGLVGLNYTPALFILGDDHFFTTSGLPLIPYIFAGLCWVRAAYAFNTLSIQESNIANATSLDFFGRPKELKSTTDVTAVDVITYTAQLVSNFQAIDPTLDKLREVTVSIEPGKPLSPQQSDKLKDVYIRLENYLINEEQLRKFTQESLRQNIKDKLKLSDLSLLGL